MTENLSYKEIPELSLNELFKNHWKEVYSFAKSKTKDHHKAEDLTCETFIKAFLKIEKYNPELKFKNWIIKICRNTFLDDYRKTSYKVTYLEELLHAGIKDTAPSPVDQMILKEQHISALKAISRLKEDEEQIITLFYLDDLSYNQISNDLNISYANARTKLNRAKHKLRNQYSPN